MIKVPSKEQQDIGQFVGKMIFLVCHSDEVESSDEFFATTVYDDAVTHLNSMDVDADTIPRVLYGVLTSAELLPEAIYGETAYVIAEDPDDSKAILVNAGFPGSDATEKTAALIDEALGDNKTTYVMSRRDLTIDNLFVLYGRKLDLGYSVHKDSIDEASVDSCVKLYADVSHMTSAIKK